MCNYRMESKRISLIILFSVFVIVAIFVGFIFGSSIMYGLASSDINDLQYQMSQINSDTNSVEIQNNTYYYNETSLSNIYKEVKDSIVVISGIGFYQTFWQTQYYEVQGSGFVYEFEDQNLVITNNHVVSDVTDIIVTFSNGNSYTGELIGSDAYSDLAVLSVSAPVEEVYPLEIVRSSNIEVGDPVIAIGSPMGLDSTMTIGIISQVGRTIEESAAGSFPIANIIQTSVAINLGNSGGPLLNYQGEVIGITTAIIADSEGLGFAIPSNTILREIESLVETGSYNQHPWLGIVGTDMSYSIAEVMDIGITYGWLITSITSGSAADNAKLEGGNKQVRINDDWVIIGGDIIIEINGLRIINGDGLMSYLEEHTQPYETINLTIVRDNQIQKISLKLGVRPSLT